MFLAVNVLLLLNLLWGVCVCVFWAVFFPGFSVVRGEYKNNVIQLCVSFSAILYHFYIKSS